MYQSSTQIRVRYAETDEIGYVYYGNYAMYCEVARVESLRSLGLEYKNLEKEHQIMMPVLEHYSKYIRPAFYDDLLTIKIFLPELPQGRIRFEYEIYNQAETLIHKAYTTLVFVDMQSFKPVPCPAFFLDVLKPHYV